MAARLVRRVFLLAAMMVMAAGLAGGFAQASVLGRADGASGSAQTGSAALLAATPSQVPGSPTPSVVPPTTAAPTTSAPAPPPSPTSAPPTTSSPSPSISGSPAANSHSFNLVYLWIALAVIVVLVLIAVISSVARGRSAQRRAWRAQATDAYNRGSGLFQEIQGAVQANQYRDPNAGARWSNVQARAEELTGILNRLRSSAPGEYEKAQVDNAVTALDALRAASQANDPAAASRLQARLRDFEDAMQGLREER
jgi:hypothetical protein